MRTEVRAPSGALPATGCLGVGVNVLRLWPYPLESHGFRTAQQPQHTSSDDKARYTLTVEHQLVALVAWVGPHAVWMALLGPVLARLVGHWFPEELFMMAVGVVAARSGSPVVAAQLMAAVWIGHFVTDHAVYFGGMHLKPRLDRFPRFSRPIERVGKRLKQSPGALLGFIPARVLPLGRGAWLAACGAVGVPWRRFVLVDIIALILNVGLWCGLGWAMATELSGLVASAQVAKIIAVALVACTVSAVGAVMAWRRRKRLIPVLERMIRQTSS